jgi:hypothetical protein
MRLPIGFVLEVTNDLVDIVDFDSMQKTKLTYVLIKYTDYTPTKWT